MAATKDAEIVELLGRVPVFSTLEHDDLERIAELAVPRTFEPGQIVFREGDASDTCYIVRSGRARAVREHPDGRTITLATFGSGDIFGELAMFEDELRSATVEAVQRTSVVAVLGPDMRRLMVEHPQIAIRLVVALGRRLRETNERLGQTVLPNGPESCRGSPRRARRPGGRGGRVRPGGAAHGHPGRSGQAGRLLARVGLALPGRARASRRDLPGPRPARRARSRRRFRAMSSKREVSAGGVVVHEGQVLVIVPTRRAADGSHVLGLPKGHLDEGETLVQAAAREVREETGVTARARCRSSARCATGMCATAAGSPRASTSSSSAT